MSRRDKLIERMRNNPRDVKFEQLRSLLLYHCFAERCNGTSHYIFTHPGTDPIPIPYNRPVKAIYVIRVLRAIDDIKEVTANDQ